MSNQYNNYEEYGVSLGNADFTFISDTGSFSANVNYTSPTHSHKFCEIFYILDGEMGLLSETEYCFSKGDCVIIPYDVKHSSIISDRSKRIALSFTLSRNPHSKNNFFSAFERYTKNEITVFKNFTGGDTFRRLAAYYCSSYSDKNALICSCLQEIMLLIKASANCEISAKASSFTDTDNYRNYVIEHYFAGNYKGGTLSDLAHLLHLSKQQISRIILKLYNKSFNKKILEERMRIAEKLLVDTELDIISIASETGYKSTGSFYEAFKRFYGTTPLKFRKSK